MASLTDWYRRWPRHRQDRGHQGHRTATGNPLNQVRHSAYEKLWRMASATLPQEDSSHQCCSLHARYYCGGWQRRLWFRQNLRRTNRNTCSITTSVTRRTHPRLHSDPSKMWCSCTTSIHACFLSRRNCSKQRFMFTCSILMKWESYQ